MMLGAIGETPLTRAELAQVRPGDTVYLKGGDYYMLRAGLFYKIVRGGKQLVLQPMAVTLSGFDDDDTLGRFHFHAPRFVRSIARAAGHAIAKLGPIAPIAAGFIPVVGVGLALALKAGQAYNANQEQKKAAQAAADAAAQQQAALAAEIQQARAAAGASPYTPAQYLPSYVAAGTSAEATGGGVYAATAGEPGSQQLIPAGAPGSGVAAPGAGVMLLPVGIGVAVLAVLFLSRR